MFSLTRISRAVPNAARRVSFRAALGTQSANGEKEAHKGRASNEVTFDKKYWVDEVTNDWTPKYRKLLETEDGRTKTASMFALSKAEVTSLSLSHLAGTMAVPLATSFLVGSDMAVAFPMFAMSATSLCLEYTRYKYKMESCNEHARNRYKADLDDEEPLSRRDGRLEFWRGATFGSLATWFLVGTQGCMFSPVQFATVEAALFGAAYSAVMAVHGDENFVRISDPYRQFHNLGSLVLWSAPICMFLSQAYSLEQATGSFWQNPTPLLAPMLAVVPLRLVSARDAFVTMRMRAALTGKVSTHLTKVASASITQLHLLFCTGALVVITCNHWYKKRKETEEKDKQARSRVENALYDTREELDRLKQSQK